MEVEKSFAFRVYLRGIERVRVGTEVLRVCGLNPWRSDIIS